MRPNKQRTKTQKQHEKKKTTTLECCRRRTLLVSTKIPKKSQMERNSMAVIIRYQYCQGSINPQN